jgi:beta-lactamase regulating signal transducer with metallopeptidase domain
VIELINWLICGTLLAAAMHAVTLGAPRVGASLRYRLWWLALATIFVAPVLPMLLPEHGVTMVRAVQALPTVEVPATAPFAGWLLAGVWALLAAYALARIVLAVGVLRRRKREALRFPAEIERHLSNWNARRGARAARLCVSPAVRSAAVFGGRHPAIAVSPELLRALTPRELDLVLMHEWAHVQRYDDVANAVQQVVRSVFGMHPGVRWCARQLDFQRELACDARVVSDSGSSKAYAACLARLAEMINVRGDLALAPGALAGSHLSARVKAVLRARPRVSRWQSWGFVTTGIGVLAAVAVSTARIAAVREPVQAAAELVARVLPKAATAMTVQQTMEAVGLAPARPSAPPRAGGAAPVQPGDSAPQPSAPRQAPNQAPPPLPTEPEGDSPPLSDGAVTVPTLTTSDFGHAHGVAVPVAVPAAPDASQDPGTWSRVADAGATVGRKTSDAGVAVGRTSSDAARSTAGFFSKMGKSIAGRF